MIKEEFSDEQVAVLQKFIRAGFDINDIKSPRLSEKQLKELYLGKKAGIDISMYNSPTISAEEMKELRQNFALRFYKYNQNQIIQLLDAVKHNVNYIKILNPELNHLQMRQIKLGERYRIDTSIYASPIFNDEQMQRLRAELIARKVVETTEEFCSDKWEKILERASDEELPAEDSADLKDIIEFSHTNGLMETYLFNSGLAVISNKVYKRVFAMLLENERELENETIFQIKEVAGEISEQLMRQIS